MHHGLVVMTSRYDGVMNQHCFQRRLVIKIFLGKGYESRGLRVMPSQQYAVDFEMQEYRYPPGGSQ